MRRSDKYVTGSRAEQRRDPPVPFGSVRLPSPSFRIAVVIFAVASFVVLLARGRPVTRVGVEPLLFATGLNQPRGIAVAPDGTVYVAEAGSQGGDQMVPGRVSALSAVGSRTVLVDALPAAGSDQPLFAQSGPAALSRSQSGGDSPLYLFQGPTPEQPFGSLSRLRPGEPEWRLEPLVVPALGAAAAAPSAPWGSTARPDGVVYVAYPAANQLVRLEPANAAGAPPVAVTAVTGFVDSGQRNPYPTGAALAGDGSVYVTLFGPEPFRPGTGKVVRVEPSGRWQPVIEALTFPIAIGIAPDGQLHVLEFANGYDERTGRFTPNSGQLLAVGPSAARRRTIVREINFPTAFRFSPSGDVFVTENGVGGRPGEGRVLRAAGQTIRALR